MSSGSPIDRSGVNFFIGAITASCISSSTVPSGRMKYRPVMPVNTNPGATALTGTCLRPTS